MRQLKNITEQISIIETNREINASILKGYLPEQNNMQRLPAFFGVKEDKSFGSEREILYQVLFDMRQDVTDLKKLVHEIMAERERYPIRRLPHLPIMRRSLRRWYLR